MVQPWAMCMSQSNWQRLFSNTIAIWKQKCFEIFISDSIFSIQWSNQLSTLSIQTMCGKVKFRIDYIAPGYNGSRVICKMIKQMNTMSLFTWLHLLHQVSPLYLWGNRPVVRHHPLAQASSPRILALSFKTFWGSGLGTQTQPAHHMSIDQTHVCYICWTKRKGKG